MTASPREESEGEQELLRLYVLYGLLFRVAMVDLEHLKANPLKISYHWFFQDLSRWAEKEHHQLRRRLMQQRCRLLTAARQDGYYVVRYRHRGYVREAIYSIEVLRAECQELARSWWMMRPQAFPWGPPAAIQEQQGNLSSDSRKEGRT
ncbi:hypothetical protein NDK47_10580 [Brevibacillus ruminantium]|uniref:Uncharacterized protein n=1 Tax=Brevibacillus ruminantium TaxID=2950604 RepID=A0ABY4WKS0_9BACL|nr:hypothetical protein [Brevibacillus ruminantium]USG67687.1 hypothetical protein NDK47_10580 [Brevibacillus ruminantium]